MVIFNLLHGTSDDLVFNLIYVSYLLVNDYSFSHTQTNVLGTNLCSFPSFLWNPSLFLLQRFRYVTPCHFSNLHSLLRKISNVLSMTSNVKCNPHSSCTQLISPFTSSPSPSNSLLSILEITSQNYSLLGFAHLSNWCSSSKFIPDWFLNIFTLLLKCIRTQAILYLLGTVIPFLSILLGVIFYTYD